MTSASKFVAAIERRTRSAAAVVAACGVALLLLYAFAIVADVLLRSTIGTPIHGLEDVATLVIPVIAASFIPYVTTERANIRATLAGQRLGAKIAARLDAFGHAVLLAFLSIAAVQFAAYTYDARVQTTMILLAPVAPSLLAVSILLGFSVLAQAVVMIRDWKSQTPMRSDAGDR